MKSGQSYIQKRDYARAFLEFQNAAKVQPKDAEPHYQMALVWLEEGNVGRAAAELQRATVLNPRHTEAQLKLAGLMTSSQRKNVLEDAKKRVEDVLAYEPDNPTALDTLAVAEFGLGNTDNAMSHLEEAVRRAPTDLRSSFMLARAKLRRKDPAGAEATMKQAVEKAPNSLQASLGLGQLYLMIGKRHEAESAFRRALALNPQYAPAHYGLAMIQLQGGDMQAAEQTLKELAALPDKEFEPLYGLFLFQQGKRDAAIAEFRRRVAKDPQDRMARTRLVAAYVAVNNMPVAENLLRSALKKNPKDTDALLQHSELRLRSGDATGAEEDLHQVLKFKPDSADAHFALAKVEGYQGLATTERQHLGEALRLNPSHLPARLLLASTLLAANDPKGDIEVLDQAPAAQKKDLRLIAARNWALMALGNTQAARMAVDEGLRAGRTPELVLQDAVLRMERADYDGAKLAADELLQKNPENIRAARVMVAVYAARNERPKAVERVRQVVSERPQSAVLRYFLGQLLVSSGDEANGRKEYEAAEALNPKLSEPGIALAELDLGAKRLDDARKNVNAVLALNNQNMAAIMLSAQIELAAGNQSAAVERYRTALKIDASNVMAMNNLAYLEAADNPDEALQIAQRALEMAPDNPSVLDTMGKVYYRKGMYASAVEQLKRAVAREPTPRRQFHLGLAYMRAGQRDLGQQTLARALQKASDLPKTERDW